jgi:predicted choloylglycine hydrolase|tara:strand:- start:615 stop:1610 length:996 start_codon:yes stop_codon:yes gene_type:complete
MFLYLRSISEDKPGEKWKEIFDRTWAHYKKWFLQEGYRNRPGFLTSSMALRNAMPEIYPIYEELCELAGGGDVESRFLSQFSPPPFMSGCSQIAWTKDANFLIRNYDYSPKLFEGVLLKSNWLKPVIGIGDCIWGLLDGMNGDGLAVSLTFGGRNISGEGFGIPLVLRYVLETCSTVDEAIAVFRRVPIHMSYNVTILDKTKQFVTVFLSPDRPVSVVATPIGTNHQHSIEWENYASMSATLPRMQFLEKCLYNPEENTNSIKGKFMQPPLYNTEFEKGFGTLYTAIYDLEKMECEIRWPNKKRQFGFENFVEEKFQINLSKIFFNKDLSI